MSKLYYKRNSYLMRVLPNYITYNLYNKNEFSLFVNYDILKNIMYFLKYHNQCQFKILSDITAIDYIKNKHRFIVVYNLISITYNTRIRVKSYVNQLNMIDSISSIFTCANWFEREIFDMFGIFFLNHPYLKRILTDYGFENYPLRKDFPLSGFTELYYNHKKKKIINIPLNLDQQFKNFSFKNTWKK